MLRLAGAVEVGLTFDAPVAAGLDREPVELGGPLLDGAAVDELLV
jgi:hypothetical protein